MYPEIDVSQSLVYSRSSEADPDRSEGCLSPRLRHKIGRGQKFARMKLSPDKNQRPVIINSIYHVKYSLAMKVLTFKQAKMGIRMLR